MGECTGEIKGDPDIAGIGVVIALFTNAGITIIMSDILWCYVYIYPRKSFKDSQYRHPKWTTVLKKLLVMQGDLELVAAVAIVVASLISMYRDEDTPLYHIFIARGLADVCMNAHSAAVIHIHPSRHVWWPRFVLTIGFVVLWMWWTFIGVIKFKRWDGVTPHCLENDNVFGGEYYHWFYFSYAWCVVGYFSLYLFVFPMSQDYADAFDDLIWQVPVSFYKYINNQCGKFGRLSLLQTWVKALWILISSIVSLVLCLLLWGFSILVASSRYLSALQTLMSFAWDAYDISKARAANAHIIVAAPDYRPDTSFQNNDNPEHDWGFGQIFPLIMLLVPFLSLFDIVKDVYSEDDEDMGRLRSPAPMQRSSLDAATKGSRVDQQSLRVETKLYSKRAHYKDAPVNVVLIKQLLDRMIYYDDPLYILP